jgi:Sulfotransferase domain
MSLKIIGSGLGRTGTYSLKLALEQLGFGNCYHMIELFKMPDNVIYFEKAEKGDPVDWPQLFEGYQSAVDYPVARYYRQLMIQYPEARVIHTTRDAESWYQSASQTILWASKPTLGRILKMMFELPFKPVLRRQMKVLKFTGRMIKLEFGRDPDKESVIQHFQKHHEEVLKTVPKEKLLIYDVKEGWTPLCNFLGVPVPHMPFPYTNTKDEFIKRAKDR